MTIKRAWIIGGVCFLISLIAAIFGPKGLHVSDGVCAAMLWINCLGTLLIASQYEKRKDLRQLAIKNGEICGNCYYDLRASPERCPECGRPKIVMA